MYESILKELSQINLDGSSGATLLVKRKNRILNEKYMDTIETTLNYAILKEFIKRIVELSPNKIEAILLIIHYPTQSALTHDILLGSTQLYKFYEVLI